MTAIFNRIKRAALLRAEAERLAEASWPLLSCHDVDTSLYRAGVLRPDYPEGLTRPEDDKELARTERILLCLLGAEVLRDGAY